ncbi:Large-conductance mechanosensitive channel [Gracilariopsis chorda]|uniref:Large-conductance mechanosensitive channel n=1 Tax=Gracilariopsis chorda TaxID=448386 RepID=A0A2V3IMB9_9FLOR|nr:Large-conductance mechanosensitive channel [Gracilariopsis chorda]|eukprot:PXF43224.1 Large-conductance mechanosensitive channel [Gracilariopsis chorda]
MATEAAQRTEVDVESPPTAIAVARDTETVSSHSQEVVVGCWGEKAQYGTGKPMLAEFRDFMFGGNLIRIAVALVLALALEKLVNQFVASFVTPIIGIIGADSFEELTFTIRSSEFKYGLFLDALFSFIVICITLFFCLILPVQRYGGRCVPSWIIRKCPYCYTDMAAIATRCPSCGSDVEPLPIGKTMAKST